MAVPPVTVSAAPPKLSVPTPVFVNPAEPATGVLIVAL